MGRSPEGQLCHGMATTTASTDHEDHKGNGTISFEVTSLLVETSLWDQKTKALTAHYQDPALYMGAIGVAIP